MVGAKSGMYEFQDGKFVKHYTTDNSALESPFNPPSKDYTIVTSVNTTLPETSGRSTR